MTAQQARAERLVRRLAGGDLSDVTAALLGKAERDHERGGAWSRTGDRPAIGRQERATVARLLHVLRHGAVSTVYQPIVSLRDGKLASVEALTRFPGRSAPPPDRWFAAAYDLRLGLELEHLAARTALEGLDLLPDGVAIAINASPLALDLPGFRELLLEHADRVVLELTEQHRVLDYGLLDAILQPLRQAGVLVAVDDAGAGFASLRHILQVRPDIVKLDRALISGIHADPRRCALASALLRFADELGSVVIAEGIEHASELRTVTDLGIPYGQGFGIAVPHPAHQLSVTYQLA